MAEDGPHLRRPGVPRAARERAEKREAHPGGRVLLPEIDGDLAWTHLRHKHAFVNINEELFRLISGVLSF